MSKQSIGLQQKIDDLMTAVPPTPNGFAEWIRKSAFKDSKYIFYKRKGKKIQGVCSSCKAMVEVSSAKHNKTGRCPACKTKITYKAINKAMTYKDTVIVSIMQKMKDDTRESYVVRFFQASLTFKNCEDTSSFPEEILDKLIHPEMRYWEGSREVIKVQKNGKTVINEYEELYDWKLEQYKWKKERVRCGYFNKILLRDYTPFIYKRNLKGLLKNTKWKYSGLDHLQQRYISITDYLYTYEEYPAIEMLSKLNLSKLLKQIIHSTTVWGGVGGIIKMHEKMLGLNKKVFNTALRLNLGISGIEFVSTLDELGRKLTDQQIVWVMENSNTETFTQLLRYVSPQKVINYVEKYCDEEKKQFMTTWRDYLQQCKKLELDIKNDFVLFPRNLEEKHDEYSKLIKMIVDEKLDQGIKVQYEKWNNTLSYQSGNLKIQVAGSHKLILKEGELLRHCVGSARYSENMVHGKKLILFLRNNGKPHYTIEFDVEELKIIQIRGYQNKATTKDVKKFINKWKVKKLLSIRDMQRKAM